MSERNVGTVGILGGGTAGWMAAALLSDVLGRSVEVVVIDDGRGPPPGSAECALPAFKGFARRLGLDEPALLAATAGSIRLGARFVNWGALGARHFHASGATSADFDLLPLHQYWLAAHLAGEDVGALEDHSIAAVMARENRFAPPSPDRQMIQSTFDHGWHLDANLLIGVLRQAAVERGARRVDGAFAGAELDGDTGFVRAVTLTGGGRVEADLWIDCSGAAAHLIGETMGAGFDDWSAWLPCNRAIHVSCARTGAFEPFSTITQRAAGWQGRRPLQTGNALVYVFSDAHQTEAAATGDLFDDLDGAADGPPVSEAFRSGRRRSAFTRNVVALGDAQGVLEPLEGLHLHLIQSALTRLLALWPDRGFAPANAAEHDRLTEAEWISARDFLILRHATTARADTPMWRERREVAPPDSVAWRIDHWTRAGRTVSPGVDVFPNPSWVSLHVGQGRLPEACDPLVHARTDRVPHRERLAGVRRVIGEAVAAMPTHADWIAARCPSPRRRS